MTSIRSRRLAALPLLALAAAVLTPTGASSAVAADTTPAACPSLPSPPPQAPVAASRVFGPDLGLALSALGDMALLKGSSIIRVGATGQRSSVALVPAPATAPSSGTVDEAGNTYLLRYPYSIDKYGADGRLLWTRVADRPLRAVFLLGTGSAQRVGAVHRDAPSSTTWTPDGAPAGDTKVFGDSFSRTAAGGVVVLDGGRYVRVFDAAGSQVMHVGDAQRDNDPSPAGAPLHFYQLGGAALLPDGGLLVTDTGHGVMVLSPEGLLRGQLPPEAVDELGLTQSSSIAILGAEVLVAVGQRFSTNQYLSRLSLADLLARATNGEAKDPRLGIGAGVTMAQPSAYVPTGQAPEVRLRFDPWWSRVASTTSICWTVQDQDALRLGAAGTATTLPLTALTLGGAGTPLALPAGLDPGAYRLNAALVRDGRAVSSTRLTFTVAAPDHRLDLAALPPGADYGGPGPARGVALSDVLGTGLHRAGLNWATLLKNGPDAPLDFSAYDAEFARAAAEAKARGTVFEVQIADGAAAETALVANGTWEARVREVVEHYRGVVDVWEAWNEPNLTYAGSPADYTNKILKPFYRAVKQGNPAATAVGGSTAGVALGYWGQLIQAGGLAAMDVVGVHPYTGHNRSLEEDGTVQALRWLVDAAVRPDGTKLPVWNTEHAWWSNGPYNELAQADASARNLLWNRALGLERWAYFLPEAGWGNDGVTFSAIEYNSTVKPAALALMTASTQIKGRPFLGEVPLGAPSTFAMRFGPRAGDSASGELLVAWTDGLALPAVVSVDTPGRAVRRTSSLGASDVLPSDTVAPVVLTSAPLFLAVDGAGRVSLTAAETFGKNAALASNGATATASSSRHASPSTAIDGDSGAGVTAGDLPSLPVWTSAAGDQSKILDVRLAGPQQINRVVVATHSNGSTVPGLRDYDVQVRSAASSAWTTVAEVRGQFYDRQRLVRFPAQTVSDIRIRVLGVNHSGYVDEGRPPTWWPNEGGAPFGPAVIAEVLAFAPGAVTGGSAPLPTASPSVSPTSPSTPAPTAPPAPAPVPTATPTEQPPAPTSPSPSPTATKKPNPGKGGSKPGTSAALSTRVQELEVAIVRAQTSAAQLRSKAAASRKAAASLLSKARTAAGKNAKLPRGPRKDQAVKAARDLDRRARQAAAAAAQQEKAARDADAQAKALTTSLAAVRKG